MKENIEGFFTIQIFCIILPITKTRYHNFVFKYFATNSFFCEQRVNCGGKKVPGGTKKENF
jgi:hypothetical protein